MILNTKHFQELRELDRKGLTKLHLRTGQFIVHKNTQKKISCDLTVRNKELITFLDRTEGKPGLCHLRREDIALTMRYLLPEEYGALVKEEDEMLKDYSS